MHVTPFSSGSPEVFLPSPGGKPPMQGRIRFFHIYSLSVQLDFNTEADRVIINSVDLIIVRPDIAAETPVFNVR